MYKIASLQGLRTSNKTGGFYIKIFFRTSDVCNVISIWWHHYLLRFLDHPSSTVPVLRANDSGQLIQKHGKENAAKESCTER